MGYSLLDFLKVGVLQGCLRRNCPVNLLDWSSSKNMIMPNESKKSGECVLDPLQARVQSALFPLC